MIRQRLCIALRGGDGAQEFAVRGRSGEGGKERGRDVKRASPVDKGKGIQRMFSASECRRIFRNPARRRSSYPFCEPSPMRCNCVRAWWARAASSRGGRGRRSVCDCSRGAYGDGRTDGRKAAAPRWPTPSTPPPHRTTDRPRSAQLQSTGRPRRANFFPSFSGARYVSLFRIRISKSLELRSNRRIGPFLQFQLTGLNLAQII